MRNLRDQSLFSSQRQIIRMDCMPWWHTTCCRLRAETSHEWLHQAAWILWPDYSQLLLRNLLTTTSLVTYWTWETSHRGGWTWSYQFKQKQMAKRFRSNPSQRWLDCWKWKLVDLDTLTVLAIESLPVLHWNSGNRGLLRPARWPDLLQGRGNDGLHGGSHWLARLFGTSKRKHRVCFQRRQTRWYCGVQGPFGWACWGRKGFLWGRRFGEWHFCVRSTGWQLELVRSLGLHAQH